MSGYANYGLKDIHGAKKNFEKALQLDSSSSSACKGLGDILLKEGHNAESKIMYEWAIKNDSSNIEAHNGLAKVNELLGNVPAHNSLV